MPAHNASNEHAVVIAGGGPTGLMLAAELALAGVDAVIVERRPNQDIEGHRALGLHSRTIEELDQRGIADRFLAEGRPMQVAGFADVMFDISGFPSRHPYGLALFQQNTERLLAAWVEELGVPTLRSSEITGFSDDGDGIEIELGDDRRLRAQYLVGCDGGRSFVRKAAGIAFPGSDPTISHLLAEAEFSGEPELGMRTDAIGIHGMSRAENRKVRIMVTERDLGRTTEPTLDDLKAALVAHYGTDYGIRNPGWISGFTDMSRQAETYRKGRVLLAGDAAHVHYPAGGQGLNLGMQDAVNLGWKLAQVVKGTSPETLLDTYHAERHPVAARVLRYTMATVALGRQDDRSRALKSIVTELVGMEEPRRRIGGVMSGLDVHYDLGDGHPLLGRRMPDLDLATADGPVRTYSLLHCAQSVLLDLGQGLDIGPWTDRVQVVEAKYDGPWELPVVGVVPAPAAVLIRPDGYVAWVSEGSDAGLAEALGTWFGPVGH